MRRKNNLSQKSAKGGLSAKKKTKKNIVQAPCGSSPTDSIPAGISKPNQLSENQWDAYMGHAIKCYHANMPIEEAEELLKEFGDYLIRRTENNGKTEYILSVRHEHAPVHMIMHRSPEGCYFNKKNIFTRPEKLLNFYKDSNVPIEDTSVFLRKAIEQPNYYLNPENIEIKQKIGEGAFGEVNEAVMRRSDGSFVKVAVKNLKGFSTKVDRDEFMKEFRFMNQFEHENIVKIYGITAHSIPMMMVLEMCYGGSLNSYLKKNPLPYKHLIKYCTDAARGMCYLSTRDVIHRDIAARNCLLGGKDEVKISDFGLSVISKDPVKAGKNQKIAIRWCAPETISTGFFQMKTDVWSYGILMWEIFNHCQFDPFPKKTNAEVKGIILSGNKPLDLPKDVPSNVSKCYSYCLFKEASFRPNFVEILKFLSPREVPPIPDEIKKSVVLKTTKTDSKKQYTISRRKPITSVN